MKITIETSADFTPKGKRTARIVKTARGGEQLRWYVSGKLFRFLSPTPDNVTLTNSWLKGE